MPEFAEYCDPVELLDLTVRKGLVAGIANDRNLARLAAIYFVGSVLNLPLDMLARALALCKRLYKRYQRRSAIC